MVYYRCECGKSEAWGSMPPSSCTGCPECGTTLDTSPAGHRTPDSHEFVKKFDENTGEPYEICMNCCRKKAELEKKE